MLRSERQYERAIRNMLHSVQSAESVDEFDTWKMSTEECEVLSACIKRGYLVGKIEDDDGELRTLDGKMHPNLLNTTVTPAGCAFLRPKRTDAKATAAIMISIAALLVSILANLDRIAENYRWLIDLLGLKG
jgi:hypothetical protein